MKATFTFTVFIPTYNRAHLLKRVLHSLEIQTYKNFECLIIDDGSTDDTKSVVSQFAQNASFPINYIWKANGGRHSAHNVAIKHAQGLFFAKSDSDDWYSATALERLLYHWESIPVESRSNFQGVCGLFQDENGNIIGTKFPEDILDTNDIIMRYRYRVEGDKIGFSRLEILKQYPFPEDLGTFVPESLVWNRIGRQFKTRFVNEVFAVKQYLSGGLSDNIKLIKMKNAKATRLFNYELIREDSKDLPYDALIKCYVNYIRHSIHQKISWQKQISEIPSKLLWMVCYPIGYFYAIKDKRLLSK